MEINSNLLFRCLRNQPLFKQLRSSALEKKDLKFHPNLTKDSLEEHETPSTLQKESGTSRYMYIVHNIYIYTYVYIYMYMYIYMYSE